MRGYELLDAIGGIDEKYVTEEPKTAPKSGNRRAIWGVAAAACLCIAVAGAVLIPRLGTRPDAQISDGAASADAKTSVPAVIPDDTQSGTEEGVYIPAIELPETHDADIAMDMIGLVVYRGGIYTQAERYLGEDALRIDALVGEHLGYATGSIDEWSAQEEYAREFAGSMSGDVYAVRGYDTDFRICVRSEIQGENGEAELWIQFLDRLNGITLDTGEDLFGDRLQIGDRVESIRWQSHDDWNWNRGNIRDAEVDPELWDAFLDEVYAGRFVNTWDPNSSMADPTSERRSIYDTENQAHLILDMEDGTTVRLRLIEGGYVGYQELGWYFVQIPGETFDAVYDACGGTHLEDGSAQGR